MAIKISDEYTNAVAPSAGWPGGSFKNRTSPSSTDGTPLEKTWADDIWGFGEAILAEGGVVHSGAPDSVLGSDRLDALKKIFAELNNPIGTIRAFSVATDPATLLGVGTWARIGAGRMVVDEGTGFAAGTTGGEVNHTLTAAEMPAHTHTVPEGSRWGGGSGLYASGDDQTDAVANNSTSGSAGSGSAHNNMPPYYVGYIWRRTA